MENQTGRKLGRYVIQDEAGRGGMSIVYKALDPALDRVVAIKVLPPQMAMDRSFVERFMREARAAARLRHPNIVVIYEVDKPSRIFCDDAVLCRLTRQ